MVDHQNNESGATFFARRGVAGSLFYILGLYGLFVHRSASSCAKYLLAIVRASEIPVCLSWAGRPSIEAVEYCFFTCERPLRPYRGEPSLLVLRCFICYNTAIDQGRGWPRICVASTAVFMLSLRYWIEIGMAVGDDYNVKIYPQAQLRRPRATINVKYSRYTLR